MILTDTHTHLYLKQFDPDRDAMLKRAMDEGVQKFFLPNIDSTSIESMLALSGNYPEHCFPMMGLHPCSVNEGFEKELELVEQYFDEGKHRFVAVGEIGIDLYWDKTFLEQQKIAFRRQVLLAKKLKLPIVIHTRNSFEVAFGIVKELNDGSLKGIFHCFSGTKEDADKVIGLGGFKLGIGGTLTYKNSGIDKVAEHVDLSHIVLETDAPYLSPVPHRGKRNESAYIRFVAEKLGEIKGITAEQIAEKTSSNSMEVFAV